MLSKKRRNLRPKDRFDIFKRDGFRCAYCGKSPPGAILELDHVVPVSSGGMDEMDNMVTSCRDCNRGKGATPLSEAPPTIAEKTAEIKEREKQYREYRKALRCVEERVKRERTAVQDVFVEFFPGKIFAKPFHNSIGKFVTLLGLEEVQECMRMACSRMPENPERALKYFCGICWKKSRGDTYKATQ